MKPRVLALILARGGSKSIPRKNILPVAGKPLIAHTIEQALSSDWIDRTIVSTDDEEIAKVARDCGAETPFLRPAEISGDEATDFQAFRHCLRWILDHEPTRMPDLVVQLRPTNPVRKIEVIDRAIQLMITNPEADALKSVSRPSESPFKMWLSEENGRIRPAMHVDGVAEPHCLPRQALPQVWWQNGYVDVVRPRVILDQGMMYGESVIPLEITEKVHELDYPEDLSAIEAALSGKIPAEPGQSASGPRHSV